MGTNKFGGDAITYEGVGESKKWLRLETYGPKLVENIVQGTARDILAESMLRLEQTGFDIVCHVHDEVVLEVPEGEWSVEEVNSIMAVNPDWTEGLPLSAAGFESPFYKKD
jgi:DNA polymerase